MRTPENVMFTGGAYSGAIEHFGHLNALIDFNIISKETAFYGNSAGTLFALLSFLYVNNRIKRCDITRMQQLVVESMRTCQTMDTTAFLFINIKNFRSFCYKDLYLDASDKIVIGITTRNGFRWIRNYKSNYHLFKTLAYSCNLSCMSTFSYKYLDGWYAYNAFRDLPPNTLISSTTYYPPICFIPFSDERIVTYLYNKGYLKQTNTIQIYNENGMEQLTDSQYINYELLFALHDKYAIIDPKWKKKLKRLFHYNYRRC
jgi:hypothetical protein